MFYLCHNTIIYCIKVKKKRLYAPHKSSTIEPVSYIIPSHRLNDVEHFDRCLYGRFRLVSIEGACAVCLLVIYP